MKKLKTPTAVTTAVLSLITIFFWAGFEIYRSLTVKPTPVVQAEIVNPLNPTLDTKTLEGLQQRLFLDDSQIGNNAAATSTPTPTLTPIPTATASPTATPGGATPSPSATP